MPYQEQAFVLGDKLGLSHPPVAMAVVSTQPEGVRINATPAVSACSFWRSAETQLFFASAEAHRGCAVGAHVMGFPLSAETHQELMGAVGLMAEVGYLSMKEVPNIPQIVKKGSGVLYGPLSDFPLAPDCVVVWVTPAQAMLLSEAFQASTWLEGQTTASGCFGRPACGALARTANSQTASLSLGCAGMRTFTEVSPALALFVIPGAELTGLVDRLGQIARSNEKMLAHYNEKVINYSAEKNNGSARPF